MSLDETLGNSRVYCNCAMDPILLDITSSAQELIQQFTYLGPFLILLLCGLGLPLPEEVTLIGSGLLVHQGEADFWLITLVCSAAILLGDSIPYFLGHKYGKSVLKRPFISRILHPERFARLEKRFLDHGNWATFMCRFLPGIRIPGYFVAGTMRMKYSRFITLDAIGVLITVPLSIHVGRLFGGQIDKLKEQMEYLHLVLGFLVLALLIILMVVKRKSKAEVARAKAGLHGPVTAAAEMHAEAPDLGIEPPAPKDAPSVEERRDGIDDPARPA
ncbi:MAG: membrane protein DedA with SNARE-associated domain [Gammaproteobacteria bacterium]|jgi:membrane protein DedA with SNARE-associated domain